MQKRFKLAVGLLLFLVKFSRPKISKSGRELAKVINDGATNEISNRCWELWSLCWTLVLRRWSSSRSATRRTTKCGMSTVIATVIWREIKTPDWASVGSAFFVMGCLASWKSRGQKNVTLSLTEDEYVASELCAELLFVRMILTFLGKKINYPIIVHCNNVGAIFLAHNTNTSHRTKHINTRYHFVCEYVKANLLKIVFVKSAEYQANPYTKNVGEESFMKNADVYQK